MSHHLVMAVFHDRDQALAAIDALVSGGIDASAIGFLATRPDRFGQLHNPNVVERSDQATSIRPGKGPFASPPGTAGSGRTPGYALRDLQEFDVPKLGPVLAGGPLAGALQASPAWPAEGAIQDALVRRGVDSGYARVVSDEIRGGGIVLTVHDSDATRSRGILERYGPVELQS